MLTALTTAGCKDQDTFFVNVRRAVKEGWKRSSALASLTINPAKMFGLEEKYGTVEVGKAANMTILTADFLDPKAKVKYMVIDGMKFDPGKTLFKFDNSPQDFGGEQGR